MPIVNKWIGCQVKGSWIKADGSPQRGMSIHFKPEKSGIKDGRIHSADSFTAQTGNDGSFVVGLIPGVYQVSFGNDTYVINVPDDISRANFADLII